MLHHKKQISEVAKLFLGCRMIGPCGQSSYAFQEQKNPPHGYPGEGSRSAFSSTYQIYVQDVLIFIFNVGKLV